MEINGSTDIVWPKDHIESLVALKDRPYICAAFGRTYLYYYFPIRIKKLDNHSNDSRDTALAKYIVRCRHV